MTSSGGVPVVLTSVCRPVDGQVMTLDQWAQLVWSVPVKVNVLVSPNT